MIRRKIICFLFVALFVGLFFFVFNYKQNNPPIIQEINAFRAENNLDPVRARKEACDFAAIRAKEAETDWSHDKFMKAVEAGAVSDKYQWYENLAGDFDTDHEVVEAWKESSDHREVLLSTMKYACVARYNNTWALEGMEPM